MSNSKHFHRILTAAIMAAMLIGTAAATTTITTRTIEASYRGIHVIVDGTEVALKDAAGNSIEPFISNGTTYLPLRVIGEALGKEVKWDDATSTVYIGDPAHLPYQVNNAVLYDGSDPDTSFSVAGTVHKTGVVLQSFHTTPFEHNLSYDGSAIWNTAGYNTMTFTIGHVGTFQRDAVLYISLDGVAAGEYQLRWDGSPQTITVPLGSSPNVKLTLIADPWVNNGAELTGQPKTYMESYGVYDVNLSK